MLLKALFKRFENISEHCATSLEIQNVIMNLITLMHDLTSQMKLKSALEFFSRLDSELKSFLSEAVEKLDRYYSISYELVCVARSKKYSIFHSVAIETSSIRRLSQSLNVDENLHSLTALQQILRSRTVVQAKALKFSLERCLRKSLQVILDDFRLIITNYYQFVKVHAEIQLLFFYELNSKRLRSRVIYFSKSACYLCHLFFKLHDQFYISRTHDRLYYKWTLPDWHSSLLEMRRRDFDVLLMQLSDVLKVKIRAVLEERSVRVNHSNESVLVMSAHWSSSNITQIVSSVSKSVVTLDLAQIQKQLSEVLDSIKSNHSIFSKVYVSSDFTNSDSHSFESSSQSELLIVAISFSSSSILMLHSSTQESITSRDLSSSDTLTDSLTTSSHTSLNPSFTATSKSYRDLTQDELVWSQISYSQIFINIDIIRLHLHLSCNIISFLNSDILSNLCWVRVKWLQDIDMKNINSQAVNVKDLAYDTEMKFHHDAACASTELHLRREEDVVSIKYTFDESRWEWKWLVRFIVCKLDQKQTRSSFFIRSLSFEEKKLTAKLHRQYHHEKSCQWKLLKSW